jgi:hypothetical protein
MFGKGVYLTDVASKAAQYCHATPSQPFAFLILARVALGKELLATKPDISLGSSAYKTQGYARCQPVFLFMLILIRDQTSMRVCVTFTFVARFDSVRAVGRFCSDPSNTLIGGNGALFRIGMKFIEFILIFTFTQISHQW